MSRSCVCSRSVVCLVVQTVNNTALSALQSSRYSFQAITQFNLHHTVCWFWSSGAGVIILAAAVTMWPKLSGFVLRHSINLSVPRLDLDSRETHNTSWVLLSRIIIGTSVYSINMMSFEFPETSNPCLSVSFSCDYFFPFFFFITKERNSSQKNDNSFIHPLYIANLHDFGNRSFEVLWNVCVWNRHRFKSYLPID